MLTEKTGDVSCKQFELLLVNCWVTPFLGMINMTIGRQKTNRSTFNAQHFKGRFGIWLYNGSTIEGLGVKIGFIYKCNTCVYIYICISIYIYLYFCVCVSVANTKNIRVPWIPEFELDPLIWQISPAEGFRCIWMSTRQRRYISMSWPPGPWNPRLQDPLHNKIQHNVKTKWANDPNLPEGRGKSSHLERCRCFAYFFTGEQYLIKSFF